MPRPAPRRRRPPRADAVGLLRLSFVDRSRRVRIGGKVQPRRLVTLIRYPALGRPGAMDIAGAAPVRVPGGRPLVIFGHGYAVTPVIYARLLQAWARAGYVVAAPYFPLENANAPGGPDESDLGQQPGDVSFLISRLLAATAAGAGPLAGLIDPREVAVSGQSDGGETALAVGYDRFFRDARVRATVILSGAQLPQGGALERGVATPPLLAVQGTADTVNPPALTRAFFRAVAPPKFLLSVFGASHLGPYTDVQPGLRVVERVTVDFLDRYLRGERSAGARLLRDGMVPGVTALTADP